MNPTPTKRYSPRTIDDCIAFLNEATFTVSRAHRIHEDELKAYPAQSEVYLRELEKSLCREIADKHLLEIVGTCPSWQHRFDMRVSDAILTASAAILSPKEVQDIKRLLVGVKDAESEKLRMSGELSAANEQIAQLKRQLGHIAAKAQAAAA